jgi:[ribosomal protein S5]-alanine N-acetyltransferase
LNPAIVLETERMRLVPWEMREWISLRPIAQDPDVLRYISDGRPWSDEHIQDFVQRQIGNFAGHGFCFWRLVRKANSTLIGFCGLQPLVVEAKKEVEIGWWLARDCWGQGLATEAASTTLRDGFERVRLGRVIALAQPANLASIRVMKKLGMSYERDVIHKGIPVVLYSISAAPAP